MLTLGDLEQMEKKHAAQHEAYVAQHDAYLANHQNVLQILSLARVALLNQEVCKTSK